MSSHRRKRPPRRKQRPRAPVPSAGAPEWNAAAAWYDEHLRAANTHHTEVLAPGVMSLLAGQSPGRLIEIGCGQGFFARLFDERGWKVTGVDIAPAMIDRAREIGPASIEYLLDNAETLGRVTGSFTAALAVMSLVNIPRPERTFAALFQILEPGAPLVLVILHPAFRQPHATHWGWDAEAKVQYRRVDRYLSTADIPIRTHPGSAPGETTTTYHRPIGWYVNTLAEHGFVIDRCEEWVSHRRSTSGHRAAAENTARAEIPMFLALRARREPAKLGIDARNGPPRGPHAP